jgi:signal transduction histidine kinase
MNHTVSRTWKNVNGNCRDRPYISSGSDLQDRNQFYVDPEDRRRMRAILERGDPVRDYEVLYRRKDGATFWGSVNATRFQVGDGAYILVMISDVSRRREAEAALRRYAERLEALLEIDQAILAAESPEAVCEQAIERLRRIAPEMAVGISLFDRETHEGVIFASRELREQRFPSGFRYPLQGVESILENLRQGHLRIVEDLRDIPDPAPAQQMLIDAGFRSVFSVPMITHGELIGILQLLRETPGAFPPDIIHTARQVANSIALALHQQQLHDEIARHAKVLEDVVAERTAELRERVGQVEEMNREMVRLLEQLQTANRNLNETTAQLTEANEQLQAFTYSISRDIQAPLNAVHEMATLILREDERNLGPRARQHAERILDAAQRMSELIGDLLDFSRMSQAEIRLEIVDMDRVLRDALRRHAEKITATQALVEIRGPLPQAMGHHSLLEIIFSNLISNALKFVPEGERPRIVVWAEPRKDRIRYWIEDNGLGIAPKYHESIFRIFKRLHDEEEYPGTGVGLAIVNKGVARLGGASGVESRPGEGSRFWIELLAPR